MFLGFTKTATSRKCHTPSSKTAQRMLQKHTALISQWFHTISHSCKTQCRPRDAGSDFLVPPTCCPSRKGEHWNFETVNKCFSLEMRLLLTIHRPKLSHNPTAESKYYLFYFLLLIKIQVPPRDALLSLTHCYAFRAQTVPSVWQTLIKLNKCKTRKTPTHVLEEEKESWSLRVRCKNYADQSFRAACIKLVGCLA